jgi:hypothetical protein
MSNLGKYRMIVTEHADTLTNKVDLFSEKELQANSNDSAAMKAINKRRDVYLTEIKRVEAFNLNRINSAKQEYIEQLDEADELNLNKMLFSMFCFVVEFKKLNRLIVTNEYLSSEQIASFSKLLPYANVDEIEDLEQKVDLTGICEIVYEVNWYFIMFESFTLFLFY